MLHALDPHSNFFDPKSYALMREDQRGKYYGVGMTVGPRNNKVIVIFPFTGTPAYKAGIHPGDVIIAVDGKSTENMSTSDVADLLKGPKGRRYTSASRAKASRSRWSSPWCATRFRATAWTCIS